jgi:hypothetical protein
MGRTERSTKKAEKPPDYVLAFNKAVYPNFTGYWMGWRWVNGKPVGRAPAVER